MRLSVVEFTGRGGLAHYTFQLCRGLAAAGAEVSLVTPREFELDGLDREFELVPLLDLWDPKPEGKPPAPPLRLLRRGMRALRWYREWGRLVLHLRNRRPDAVLFGDLRFPTDLVPLWLLAAQGVRMADVCHNVLPFRRGGGLGESRWQKAFYGRMHRLFEAVFVHWEVNRRRFREAFPRVPGSVVCIPHGPQEIFRELASADWTAERLRRELDLGPDHRVVLFFGTLHREKGLEDLVRAFGSLAQDHPDARLVLAGFPLPGYDLAGLGSEIEATGRADRVRLLPRYIPSEAVAAWMELAEVVVFPYREIFASGALHVARAFGRPVVATDTGAFRQAVRPGETGLLVAPRDPEALARALGRLLEDPAAAREMGERGRREDLRENSWEEAGRRIVGALKEASRGATLRPRSSDGRAPAKTRKENGT